MKNFNIILLAPMALLVAGCTTADCDGLRHTTPLAGFYASTPEQRPVALTALTLYGKGAPGDSLLLNEASSVTEVELPFRITESSTTFVLDYLTTPAVRDTITFDYITEPRLATVECGMVYDYRLTAINHTCALIDSVTCPEGIITNAVGQNLRIYLRTYDEQ